LGYQNISRLISRFEDLAKLKHIKLLGRSEGIVQGKIDRISGLLNFSAFLEIAEQEQQRHNRYGNAFSLMLCELPQGDKKEKRAPLMRIIGDLIRDNIRSIDSACRWKAGKFLILLPETDGKAAKKVSKKLKESEPNLRISIREQDEESIAQLLAKLV
jgi:PleD family two-component response regulator